MGITNKVLAQANPGQALTDLYRAPNGVNTVVTVTVCNTGVFVDTYRLAVAVNGASNDLKQYLAYDKQIDANSTDSIVNIYLRPGDVIRVSASVSDISFTAMGTEQN